MERTYWHKQTVETPLYPNLLWSRPENRQSAGKLLIVGGNVHALLAPAEAYQVAFNAGVGLTRVLLPDALKKQVAHLQGQSLEILLAPSTPSGSFSQQALAELLEQSAWADALLIAGDLGRNSETAILLEKTLQKTSLPLIVTKDAAEYCLQKLPTLQERGNVGLILTIVQLQKLVRNLNFELSVTFDMGLVQLVDLLHKLTTRIQTHVMVYHNQHMVVATLGNVSTSPFEFDHEDTWRVAAAAYAAVWWLQNPAKPFEALTTSVIAR